MAKFSLWLTATESLALEKTSFSHPIVGGELKAVRGKTAGAYHGFSTFQWTPAVQSMVVLVLRTVAFGRQNHVSDAVIQGYEGSPASSLDYSIGKTPAWMLDIFGVDRSGAPLAKRLFRRTNPERKRSGPVSVALNDSMLSYSDITIYINDETVQDPAVLLESAKLVEEIFAAQRSGQSAGSTAGGKGQNRKPLSSLLAIAKRGPGRRVSGHNSMLPCPCCGELLAISFLSPSTQLSANA